MLSALHQSISIECVRSSFRRSAPFSMKPAIWMDIGVLHSTHLFPRLSPLSDPRSPRFSAQPRKKYVRPHMFTHIRDPEQSTALTLSSKMMLSQVIEINHRRNRTPLPTCGIQGSKPETLQMIARILGQSLCQMEAPFGKRTSEGRPTLQL